VSRRLRPQPLKRRPSVTVVVPCYNYGHYLPLALGTVLGQAGVDVEAIVIDDASPDGSGAVVREMAAADERIKAIVHERNRGHIATYNEGLEEATGDYVVLMSADDALAPGALARAAALMEAEPSVGFTYGFPLTFVDTPLAGRTDVRGWTVWRGLEWIEVRCRKGLNCILCPEVVMRTSIQHAIGGYDPQLPHSGDLEMWMRAAAVSDVGRVNGPVQAHYRVHAASMQRTTYSGHVADLEGRLAAFEKVLASPDSQIPRRDEMMATARRSLAIAAGQYARLAYEGGREELEPIDEYLAFAERVWPAAGSLREWRRVRRRAAGGGRLEAVVAPGRQVSTDVMRRLRWRRWRWSGV
jgi:glycosyltransferase involved in cell wall biosynthesis